MGEWPSLSSDSLFRNTLDAVGQVATGWYIINHLYSCKKMFLFRDDYISIFRDDYINWHKPVPFSCRHPVTGTFSLSMLVD